MHIEETLKALLKALSAFQARLKVLIRSSVVSEYGAILHLFYRRTIP